MVHLTHIQGARPHVLHLLVNSRIHIGRPTSGGSSEPEPFMMRLSKVRVRIYRSIRDSTHAVSCRCGASALVKTHPA